MTKMVVCVVCKLSRSEGTFVYWMYTKYQQNTGFYEACNIVAGGARQKDALCTRGICNLIGLFK